MQKVINIQKLLKYSYGIVVLVVALDKLLGTNFIVDWSSYVNSSVAEIIAAETFVIIIGIIELVVAIMLLSNWTRIAAYISAAWLVLIAINLLMLGLIDIAARDLLLAVGAYALAQLTEVREGTR